MPEQPPSQQEEPKKPLARETMIFILCVVLGITGLAAFLLQRKNGIEPGEDIRHVAQNEDDAQPGDAPVVTLDQLKKKYIANPDLILLDVQEREGYLAQHIPGSLNIPFDEVPDRLVEIPKGREVVVSCIGNDVLTCALSTRAARELASKGYKNLLDYRGGVSEWKNAGLPIITNTEIHVRAAGVEDLHTRIADRQDIAVIDIRDEAMYAEGHIPTAIHVDFTHIKDELVRIPRHKDVYVYDDAGHRSKLFVDELVRNGYILVADVPEGFNAWHAKGYDIQK